MLRPAQSHERALVEPERTRNPRKPRVGAKRIELGPRQRKSERQRLAAFRRLGQPVQGSGGVSEPQISNCERSGIQRTVERWLSLEASNHAHGRIAHTKAAEQVDDGPRIRRWMP